MPQIYALSMLSLSMSHDPHPYRVTKHIVLPDCVLVSDMFCVLTSTSLSVYTLSDMSISSFVLFFDLREFSQFMIMDYLGLVLSVCVLTHDTHT